MTTAQAKLLTAKISAIRQMVDEYERACSPYKLIDVRRRLNSLAKDIESLAADHAALVTAERMHAEIIQEPQP
jgi:prefoldin subunit 5